MPASSGALRKLTAVPFKVEIRFFAKLEVSIMSSSSSLSAGSSRSGSEPIGSEQNSRESIAKSLSVGHVEWEIQRKENHKVSLPSSERTVENVIVE